MARTSANGMQDFSDSRGNLATHKNPLVSITETLDRAPPSDTPWAIRKGKAPLSTRNAPNRYMSLTAQSKSMSVNGRWVAFEDEDRLQACPMTC